MLVAAVKKTFILLSCGVTLLFATHGVHAEAESGPSLNLLTKQAIELSRQLLETEERLANLGKNNLSIYLNIDNLPQKSLQDIVIQLDGQVISELNFDETEYQTLASGAMKRIFSATVKPGDHTISVSINNAPDSDHHNSQSLKLKKGTGKDVLKVTLSNLIRDPKPGIFFDLKQGKKDD